MQQNEMSQEEQDRLHQLKPASDNRSTLTNAIHKAREGISKGQTPFAACKEPCPTCFSAIHWAKIDQIVCGYSISDAQGLGFSELTISNLQLKLSASLQFAFWVGS